MQSRRLAFVPYLVAFCVSCVCGALVIGWHLGPAAFLLELLAGGILGFVAPKGAWRWALLLVLWVPVALLSHASFTPSEAQACGEGKPPDVSVLVWPVVLAPFIAVLLGVAADWFLSEALRWLSFLHANWIDRTKPVLRICAVVAGVLIVLGSVAMLAQPLHPYSVGKSYCWDEYCFAIISVKRTKQLGSGPNRVRSRGTFYVVTADMETPWWGRFYWSNSAVYATDYAGTNYEYSPSGQRALDASLHSNRSQCHLILGAGETETIAFDLPDDIVQPRLLVRDTLGLEGLLGGLRSNLFYVKPAFNLRYD